MQKDIPPKKVFGNSEFCSSRQNYRRPNSLENCGFGGNNKTQRFQKLFGGRIFLYLLNIFATAAPKLDGSLPANPVNDRRTANAVTLKSTFCPP